MKKTTRLIIATLLVAGIATAGGEKKKAPSTSDVETALEAAGAEHFPEKMKVGKVGSVKAGDTYYHAYCGTTKKEGYRVIFMDNKGNYLGYYVTEFEPSDYEEGAILLDSGESDEDGNTSYFAILVSEKGPSDKIQIDGIATPFVKNQKNEAKAEAAAEAAATEAAATVEKESMQPEYREWIISRSGKKIPVRAIYVKSSGDKVFLKSEVNGKTVPFKLRELSEPDQEYIKQLD